MSVPVVEEVSVGVTPSLPLSSGQRASSCYAPQCGASPHSKRPQLSATALRVHGRLSERDTTQCRMELTSAHLRRRTIASLRHSLPTRGDKTLVQTSCDFKAKTGKAMKIPSLQVTTYLPFGCWSPAPTGQALASATDRFPLRTPVTRFSGTFQIGNSF